MESMMDRLTNLFKTMDQKEADAQENQKELEQQLVEATIEKGVLENKVEVNQELHDEKTAHQEEVHELDTKTTELEEIVERQVDELTVYKTCLQEGITDFQIIEDITSLLRGEPENIIRLLATAQKENKEARERAGKVIKVQEEEKKNNSGKRRPVYV